MLYTTCSWQTLVFIEFLATFLQLNNNTIDIILILPSSHFSYKYPNEPKATGNNNHRTIE